MRREIRDRLEVAEWTRKIAYGHCSRDAYNVGSPSGILNPVRIQDHSLEWTARSGGRVLMRQKENSWTPIRCGPHKIA